MAVKYRISCFKFFELETDVLVRSNGNGLNDLGMEVSRFKADKNFILSGTQEVLNYRRPK